jgi:diguanylate cyclase (GGDEF)-like protein
MKRETLSKAAKVSVIAVGAACFAFALITMPPSAFSWSYFAILAFGVFVAPRMSLTLPRSKFAISFSDALIFLSFLLYGGQAAIVVAAVEMFASCVYLRSRGFRFGTLMVPTNVAINALYTFCTFVVWLLIQQTFAIEITPSTTQRLISILGILALSQFYVSSTLAALFQSLTDGSGLWQTWRKECFSSSMTQIVGAGLAGLIYKLVNYGDLMTGLIAFAALAVAYLNYRQSIFEINDAIANVEKAERQNAETERQRRQEAERHAGELSRTLEKEALANDALRKSEKDLQYAAQHDSLTGLANRKYLGDILRKLINEYRVDPTVTFQVLFIDIKSFKDINDTLGHTIGDKVLSIAAKRFSRLVNSGDTVARIGGDEFAIVLRNLASAGKAQKVARRIHQSIIQPFSLSGNKISIDVNIGIAPCDTEYNTPEEILRDADIAMHYAKERNDGPAVFTKELRHRFLERVRFEMDLRHAIDRKELALHYQPIVSLADGRLIGFESLLRWHHAEFGLIPPNKFIPIAEQSGLILPITQWILRESARQIALWQKISPQYADLMVSVNISGKHLSNDDLIDDVESVLESTRLSPKTLKLEITESTAMENAEHTVNILRRLKQIGVQLSIDDFGTGYSSLSYLQRLPFDTLKIDRSFVYSVGANGENSGILQTIISLAKNLNMRVIAEGIETESQLTLLRNLGCDLGQGFLIAKPKNSEETETLLYQRPNWLPGDLVQEVESSQKTAEDAELPVF